MIRTRFAPSPTGYLHVGGARTALFNWLFARKFGGEFVVRIEDTDQVRSTAESAAGILADLQWLGLDWDRGPVPGEAKNEYFQSMRLEIYNQYLNQLLQTGAAYEAYETPAQLAAMRAKAEKEKRPFRYRKNMPGRAPAGAGPTVLRFEMPHESVGFNDLILGPISVGADEHDDIVIRKSDGFPTYHFAVVVDDHLMGITHVLRAQEHLMNTPKHLGLYRALGWTPPAHAHMPLVFNMDNTKMSKRDKSKAARHAVQMRLKQEPSLDINKLAAEVGISSAALQGFLHQKQDDPAITTALAAALKLQLPEIDVQDFRRSGYLADALLNFIALIGWAPGENREILTRGELRSLFSLEGIGKTNGRFDRKKLLWMNGEYIRRSDESTLIKAIESFNAVTDYPLKHASSAVIHDLVGMYRERMSTLAEMADNSRFFFGPPVYDTKAVRKFVSTDNDINHLREIISILNAAPLPWNASSLSGPLEKIVAMGDKRGAASQILRVAVSGGAVSPPLLETLTLLGKDTTMERLYEFQEMVQAGVPT
jgi:glutamyl/glutaminyl-tRNA synthetase